MKQTNICRLSGDITIIVDIWTRATHASVSCCFLTLRTLPFHHPVDVLPRNARTLVSRAAEVESCLHVLIQIHADQKVTPVASPVFCSQLKSFDLSVTASLVQQMIRTACPSYSHLIMWMPAALFPVQHIFY